MDDIRILTRSAGEGVSHSTTISRLRARGGLSTHVRALASTGGQATRGTRHPATGVTLDTQHPASLALRVSTWQPTTGTQIAALTTSVTLPDPAPGPRVPG